MSAITYNGGTPGGDIVAKSVAGLLHSGDTLQIAAGLCDEVGAIGVSPYGDNFLAANNPVFDVAAGQGQAFSDNINAISVSFQAWLDANSGEMRNRLLDLYQG